MFPGRWVNSWQRLPSEVIPLIRIIINPVAYSPTVKAHCVEGLRIALSVAL
jgi:hypothetical protein